MQGDAASLRNDKEAQETEGGEEMPEAQILVLSDVLLQHLINTLRMSPPQVADHLLISTTCFQASASCRESWTVLGGRGTDKSIHFLCSIWITSQRCWASFSPLFESLLCLTKWSGTFVKRVGIWSDLFMPRFNNLKSTYGTIQSFFSRDMEEMLNIATECLTAQFSNTWPTQRHFSAFMFNLSHLHSIYTKCLKPGYCIFLA